MSEHFDPTMPIDTCEAAFDIPPATPVQSSSPCARDPTSDDAIATVEERQVAKARAMLVKDFHIDAAFVGMPKLARILGCSAATLWSHIRKGSFFMPYRKVNGTLLVSVDDLARWYCSASGVVAPEIPGRWPSDAGGDEPIATPAAREQEKSKAVARIVEEALVSMGTRAVRQRRR